MAQRYQIFGVPKTVINDQVEFEGAIPEEMFVQEALNAALQASDEAPPDM